MSFQQRENSGALFTNAKGDNASRPDLKGDLNIGGVVYELAGWTKMGSKGKFISLSVKPKGERKPAPIKPAPASSTDVWEDSDMPPF